MPTVSDREKAEKIIGEYQDLITLYNKIRPGRKTHAGVRSITRNTTSGRLELRPTVTEVSLHLEDSTVGTGHDTGRGPLSSGD